MPLDPQRWDITHPRFVLATLRTLIGLAVCVTVGGTLVYRPACDGLLSGAGVAVALFIIAMQAGRVFARTHDFGRTMLWLLLSQCILWVAMAVLLAAVKVHPIGFVVSVSILPVAVLVTWGWYLLRGRISSS